MSVSTASAPAVAAAARGPWLRLLVAAAFVLAMAGAWALGRGGTRVGQAPAPAAPTGYDLGVASAKPRPTGQVREFQLVAREAAWEIAPGVSVLAFSYNGQVLFQQPAVTE